VTPAAGARPHPYGLFAERIVIVSPHVDDETLGCGALMALLAATHEIHVVFATDSSRSPEHPRDPECFLPHRYGRPAPLRAAGLVRLAAACEPPLKTIRERVESWLRN
jgi:hypothetical protein